MPSGHPRRVYWHLDGVVDVDRGLALANHDVLEDVVHARLEDAEGTWARAALSSCLIRHRKYVRVWMTAYGDSASLVSHGK